LERARREVEVLSTVESQFVVAVLSEAVEIGDRLEAVRRVEEQLDGSDLRDLVTTFPWAPLDVWTLIRDVANGLCACHELDVLHRDISRGNVRRRASGRFGPRSSHAPAHRIAMDDPGSIAQPRESHGFERVLV
jgi:serine/threonine protein kinase